MPAPALAHDKKSALECAQFEKSHLLFFALIIAQIKEEIIIFSDNPAHDADVCFKKRLSESYDNATDEIDQLNDRILTLEGRLEEVRDRLADLVCELYASHYDSALLRETATEEFEADELKNIRVRAMAMMLENEEEEE